MLAEDEYYEENGLMVFTERYHLRRGTCCGSGCRHCPYGHERVPPERRAQLAPPRPYFVALVLLAVLLLALGAPAQDKLELYVRNRPFEGPVRMLGGELYAPVDDLLRALGCGWEEDEAAISVRLGSPGPDPRLMALRPIVIEGRPAELGAGVYGERLYCNVRMLARAVGSEYRVNAALGTADLYAPAALPTGASESRPVVRAGQPGSQVELTEVRYGLTRDHEQPELSILRGYAVISNRGPGVGGLTVRVEVLDESGQVLGRFGEALGKLHSGGQVTYQFPAWPNLSRAQVKPRVEVTHLR